jgi:hypothetical protein
MLSFVKPSDILLSDILLSVVKLGVIYAECQFFIECFLSLYQVSLCQVLYLLSIIKINAVLQSAIVLSCTILNVTF